MDTITKVKVELCPNPEYMTFHTRFNVLDQPGLKIIIDNIPGVEHEWHEWYNRYQFSVRVGTLFNRNEIAAIIQQKINEYFA